MGEVIWLLLINALLIFLMIGNKVALWDGATEIGSSENSQHRVRKDARKGELSLIHSEKENCLVFCQVITMNMCILFKTNVHTILSDKFQTEGHWERIQWEGTESHRDNRGIPGQYQPS